MTRTFNHRSATKAKEAARSSLVRRLDRAIKDSQVWKDHMAHDIDMGEGAYRKSPRYYE